MGEVGGGGRGGREPSGGVAVYVASPLGFTEAGRLYNAEVLLPALHAAGFDPIDPWADLDAPVAAALAIEDPEQRVPALVAANHAAGAANAERIRRARALLAVLDGSDVDSGTAAEIGFAAALGLVIIGLRTDFRLSADNEGAIVNLQVEHFVRLTGGDIHSTLEEALDQLAALVRDADHGGG